MDIIELSEIQQLLFNLEYEEIEEVGSIIIRSDYFSNNEKQSMLLSNISLLIELRPKQFDKIINLCKLLNHMDQTNSISVQLFKYLLVKLSQEQQFFIFKAYYNDLFPYLLIDSSIEYLINSSQEQKAYNLARWFPEEIFKNNIFLYRRILSFNFLKTIQFDSFKNKLNTDFLLGNPSASKLSTEQELYDILRNDDIERLQVSLKQISDIMLKQKHFFSINTIYPHLVESSALLDESLSVFDICAYYNSINCFEKLCSLVQTNNKYLQSLYQERIKPFNVLHYAIAGGSINIISFLIDQIKFPIDDYLQCSIYFHRNDLLDFFSEICKDEQCDPLKLLNSSKDVWGTPLFQACHTNNVEIFLQMIHYKSLQTSFNLPSNIPIPSTPYPNLFFYNLNLYLYIYDNVIKSRDAIGKEIEKGNEPLFKFKNFDEADSALSLLFSSIKHSKEMLTTGLFYLAKKGYNELLELMINELLISSKLTEKILKERPNHDHDESFQFLFDLNSTDQYGNTLLIHASKFNQISCVKALLNIDHILHSLNEFEEEKDTVFNINIDIVNNEGRSALDYACLNGNYDIVEAILATEQVSIENLHKSLITCLRSCSFCDSKFYDVLYSRNNIYSLIYPYAFVNKNTVNKCSSNGRKFKGNEPRFEKILKLVIQALRQTAKTNLLDSSSSGDFINTFDENSSDKFAFPLCLSMYLKTIEKYSIENDNLEIFKALMNSPETLKTLTQLRCTEIINDMIRNNSTRLLNYVFSKLQKNDIDSQKENLNVCPIIIDRNENFLRKAISLNKYDSSAFLFSLGIFDIAYDDVFTALKDPEITRLVYENKPNLIINNINKLGKSQQTLLTQASKSCYVESFKFLQKLPAANINANGSEYDSVNESFRSKCDEIFLTCILNPGIDMNRSSFVAKKALKQIIEIGDPIATKKILDNNPDIDILEPYKKENSLTYNVYDYGYQTPKNLMETAIYNEKKDIIEYFNYYLALHGKVYTPSPTRTTTTRDNKKEVNLKELDINLERTIVDNDIESFKKQINKDTINMHFERNGYTPLITAILFERVEMVKYLLSLPEIDVNLENEPRKYSAGGSYINYPFETSYNIDLCQKNTMSYGDTPLIVAVKMRNKDIVQLLLAMPSIDANKASSNGNATPLIQAIKQKGGKTAYCYQLKKNNKVATRSQNKEKSEEELMKENDEQFIINELIKSDGIDINKPLKNTSPIIEAANQLETIKLMVDLFTDLPPDSKKTKLDLERQSYGKKTAVEITKNEEIKKILIEKGAIVNNASDSKKTQKYQSSSSTWNKNKFQSDKNQQSPTNESKPSLDAAQNNEKNDANTRQQNQKNQSNTNSAWDIHSSKYQSNKNQQSTTNESRSSFDATKNSGKNFSSKQPNQKNTSNTISAWNKNPQSSTKSILDELKLSMEGANNDGKNSLNTRQGSLTRGNNAFTQRNSSMNSKNYTGWSNQNKTEKKTGFSFIKNQEGDKNNASNEPVDDKNNASNAPAADQNNDSGSITKKTTFSIPKKPLNIRFDKKSNNTQEQTAKQFIGEDIQKMINETNQNKGMTRYVGAKPSSEPTGKGRSAWNINTTEKPKSGWGKQSEKNGWGSRLSTKNTSKEGTENK